MTVPEVQFGPDGGLTSEGLEYQTEVFAFHLRAMRDRGLLSEREGGWRDEKQRLEVMCGSSWRQREPGNRMMGG